MRPPYLAVLTPDVIILSGSAYDSSNLYHLVTIRSADGGATWTKIDDFNLSPTKQSHTNHVFQTGNQVLVVGSGQVGSYNRWLVRGSSDQGVTWSTLDSYAYDSSVRSANAWGGMADANGVLYVSGNVSGYFSSTQSSKRWLVRKSTDRGSSWTNVHDFLYHATPDKIFSSLALEIQPNGTIYDIGEAQTANSDYRWITRRSFDGLNWTTVDDYQRSSGKNSIATSVIHDPSGTLYVGGYGIDESDTYHWTVRTSSDGVTWTMSDDFQLVGGQRSSPNWLYRDNFENLFGVGVGYDSDAKQRWLVRKMACNRSQASKIGTTYDFLGSCRRLITALKLHLRLWF